MSCIVVVTGLGEFTEIRYWHPISRILWLWLAGPGSHPLLGGNANLYYSWYFFVFHTLFSSVCLVTFEVTPAFSILSNSPATFDLRGRGTCPWVWFYVRMELNAVLYKWQNAPLSSGTGTFFPLVRRSIIHRLVALWWSIEKCCVSNIFLYWFLMAQWALVPFASATEALCILYKAFLSGFAFSSSVSTFLPLLTWAGFLLWIIFAFYVDSDHWSALSRQWSDPWSLTHSLLHTCNFPWDCWELICILLCCLSHLLVPLVELCVFVDDILFLLK